ncbi:MAG: histidine kinase [Chitinophagaceae bacterium]|nr:histidine kinase [Chitinophagaceae bacterium]
MPAITSEYFHFTEDGLMWFSTSHGLTSFDGSEIVYHSTTEQANNLGLTRIFSIAEDQSNNLYIGGWSVLYFNRETKYYDTLSYIYKDIHKKLDAQAHALYIDKNGLVYYGTGSHGLFIYDPINKKTKHFNLHPGKPDSWEDRRYNTVVSFAAHATDTSKLWVGTYHGIYLFDKKTKSFTQNFKIVTPRRHIDQPLSLGTKLSIDISKMDVVDDSTIWCNSWAGGFANYNSKTGDVHTYLHDALFKSKDRYFGYVIRQFGKLPDGKYLLGIYNPHPGVFDPKTTTLQQIKLSADQNFDAVRFVTNDRQGNVWLLSKGNLYVSIPGYLRLKQVPLNLKKKLISPLQLRGIHFDTATKQYFGAVFNSTAVHVFDKNFNQVNLIPSPVINNYFTHQQAVTHKITKDGKGRWWTAGWENYVLLPGASKFELAQNKFPLLAWMQAKGEFLDVVTDKNGNILYRQGNGKVFHINHITLQTDTIDTRFENTDDIDIKSPSNWYDSFRNCIYLVKKTGISQYNLDTKKNRIIPLQSLYGNLKGNQGISAPALDCDGNLWFMIPKFGIRIIDPVSLRCIDSIRYGEKGLIRGDYTAVTGAEKPYILFRSLNGIIVYDYKNNRSYVFDGKNGLSNPDNISLLYNNGHLVVGQHGSFEYLALKDLQHHTFSVKPTLNTIKVDGSTIYVRGQSNSDGIISFIKYNHNSLVFSFSAQEFFLPERIEYAYLLKGINTEWQYTNSFNRRITYSKLTPGKYVFMIKAQKLGGDWSTEPVEYAIEIVPAFWQTFWFKILSVLLLLVLVAIFIRRRTKTIRYKEKQKLQHAKNLMELEAKALRAQMNPHFIFNSLNSIKSLINKSENEKAANYLTTFSKLIRTLFQNSDKREVSLYDELETCKLYTQIEKMRFGDKVDFLFDIDESLDLKDIKVPALILQPFIENAIWHGLVPQNSGGKVVISLKNLNGLVECTIDDDGIGRALSKQYKSLYEGTHESKGIGLTKSRLELDKLLNDREDNIEIFDKINADGTAGGTKVVLTFKENNSW